MVDILEDNLEHYSNVLEKGVLDKDMIRNDKSTGAAGGIGYALKVVFDKVKLVSGAKLIFNELEFEKYLKDSDLVITGEGKVD